MPKVTHDTLIDYSMMQTEEANFFGKLVHEDLSGLDTLHRVTDFVDEFNSMMSCLTHTDSQVTDYYIDFYHKRKISLAMNIILNDYYYFHKNKKGKLDCLVTHAPLSGKNSPKLYHKAKKTVGNEQLYYNDILSFTLSKYVFCHYSAEKQKYTLSFCALGELYCADDLFEMKLASSKNIIKVHCDNLDSVRSQMSFMLQASLRQ
jgi:hypothetical protein